MMERKFARFFHKMVHELIPDNEQRDRLFDSLRKYQLSQDLQKLLVELRLVLDEPDKLELYEFIRPLVLVRHQMEYSYLAPAVPGVRLRTVRLTRAAGQSLGFAVRGGYEFSVGVFVSSVERGSQAERHGLRVGDEIVRVNGFTIAEAIHDDVLNLIKSKEEIVLKVTHIGMLPVKNHVSDAVTWKYVEDLDSKPALEDVLSSKQAVPGRGSKGLELKLFIDCTGHESMGCGILSGPSHYPGIFVEKVRPGSLGEEVGLEVGDQIVEVNDTSFLSISHKEAVVVLKASKQLNVIVRKHAGLKLFENRSAPVRASVSSGTSSQPHRPPSPSAGQRTSSSKAWEASRSLDEGQLIAEQLGRSGLFKRSSEITGPSQDLTSSSHQFSNNSSHTATRADVHSDSGSAGGEGHRIPVEEFNPLELDGRELQSFVFPKWKKLRVELEGGMGTPLAGRIVVAAVFDEGAAKEEGLQTGDQIVMVNGRKLTDITVAQAEQIIEEAYNSAKEMIQIVYIKSSFFNDEECVTYF